MLDLMPCLCYLSIVSFLSYVYFPLGKSRLYAPHNRHKSTYGFISLRAFFAQKSATGYAASSHNGKKEGSNAEKI